MEVCIDITNELQLVCFKKINISRRQDIEKLNIIILSLDDDMVYFQLMYDRDRTSIVEGSLFMTAAF